MIFWRPGGEAPDRLAVDLKAPQQLGIKGGLVGGEFKGGVRREAGGLRIVKNIDIFEMGGTGMKNTSVTVLEPGAPQPWICSSSCA